jgi:hypothetical protein
VRKIAGKNSYQCGRNGFVGKLNLGNFQGRNVGRIYLFAPARIKMEEKLEGLMLVAFVGVSAYCMYLCLKLYILLQVMSCNFMM